MIRFHKEYPKESKEFFAFWKELANKGAHSTRELRQFVLDSLWTEEAKKAAHEYVSWI